MEGLAKANTCTAKLKSGNGKVAKTSTASSVEATASAANPAGGDAVVATVQTPQSLRG